MGMQRGQQPIPGNVQPMQQPIPGTVQPMQQPIPGNVQPMQQTLTNPNITNVQTMQQALTGNVQTMQQPQQFQVIISFKSDVANCFIIWTFKFLITLIKF